MESTMSIQALREYITRQAAAATSLTALGALLDTRVNGAPLDPVLEARIAELPQPTKRAARAERAPETRAPARGGSSLRRGRRSKPTPAVLGGATRPLPLAGRGRGRRSRLYCPAAALVSMRCVLTLTTRN